MVKRRKLIEADPDFVDLMRDLKREFDFASDRRTTKEIARMLKSKPKRKQIIL